MAGCCVFSCWHTLLVCTLHLSNSLWQQQQPEVCGQSCCQMPAEGHVRCQSLQLADPVMLLRLLLCGLVLRAGSSLPMVLCAGSWLCVMVSLLLLLGCCGAGRRRDACYCLVSL